MPPAIVVENLGKSYRVQHEQTRGYRTLRESLTAAAAKPINRLRSAFGSQGSFQVRSSEEFWALKDINFEVHCGEVIGIIGRNGAGKSTLLKILSRITKPTRGRATLYGRVGSLLEVGTGFHPELSGRENIFMNGSILGMSRREISRHFDAIVDFSEIEKFLDTPVKRYSSGMYVRLAFAVAAHLDPEILLVDEVLSVGDAAFQEKCMGSMRQTASSGRTVFFVSHNMASIQHLCNRAVLFKAGQVVEDGPPHEVIASYLADISSDQKERAISVREWPDRQTNGKARITHFEIANGNGETVSRIPVGKSISFSMTVEIKDPILDPCFGVVIHDESGDPILDLRSIHAGLRIGRVRGCVTVCGSLDRLGLYPGTYLLSPWVTDSTCSFPLDWAKLCSTLSVDPNPGPSGDLKLDPEWGKYWVESNWKRL